jgi:acetyl-CoA synthetase
VGGPHQRGVQLRRPARRAGWGDKVAIHWVGEPEDDTREITYADLKDQVCQAANALVELGVETGDRVAIYLPMIPETVVAMLACARIGAPHTVVFGGFSADALANRVADCEARVIITADGGYRRGAASALKPAVDEAVGKAAELGPEGRQGAGGPAVRARTSTGTTAATCGGTTASRRRPPSTRASSSTPSTRCT